MLVSFLRSLFLPLPRLLSAVLTPDEKKRGEERRENMELFWYTVLFLTFWSRLLQAAPLAVNYPAKLYAPCGIVQQSDFIDSKASRQSEFPETITRGHVSSNNIDCGSGIPCPCPSLEKAPSSYPRYAQNHINHHTGDNKAPCVNATPESKDEDGNTRLYCSCAPVLSSAECYSLAMPVLVMMAIGLAVHYILKRSGKGKNGNKNDGSKYARLSSSGLETNEKGIVVSSDRAQDQDVESFDDSNFPMG